jgi:hypothetical protein
LPTASTELCQSIAGPRGATRQIRARADSESRATKTLTFRSLYSGNVRFSHERASASLRSSLRSRDVPGYKPQWLVDLASEYTRELDFQRVVNREISTVWETETVNRTATPGRPEARTARTIPGAASARR